MLHGPRRPRRRGREFQGPSGSASAEELANTYWVRAQTTAEDGIATVGMATAVSALRAAGASRVAIGGIGGLSYGWYFIIFTDHDSSTFLACADVEQRARLA